MNEELESLSGSQELSEVIFHLIDWSEKTGRLRDFLRAMATANPGGQVALIELEISPTRRAAETPVRGTVAHTYQTVTTQVVQNVSPSGSAGTLRITSGMRNSDIDAQGKNVWISGGNVNGNIRNANEVRITGGNVNGNVFCKSFDHTGGNFGGNVTYI